MNKIIWCFTYFFFFYYGLLFKKRQLVNLLRNCWDQIVKNLMEIKANTYLFNKKIKHIAFVSVYSLFDELSTRYLIKLKIYWLQPMN